MIPLHERLEVLARLRTRQADSWRVVDDEAGAQACLDEAALLLEAAAVLRPPEGEVGALCERLECHAENNEIASNAMGTADAAPYVEAAKLDRAALAHLRRFPEEREAGRLEERERIARRLEEEADVTPCSEDATVYRSAATLVRADFSYNGAEEYEDALAAAERRLAAVEAEMDALIHDNAKLMEVASYEATRATQIEVMRDRMRDALISSALRFDVYACLHRAKKTPDGDAKAQTNTAMAEECRRALAPAPAAEGGQ